MKLIFIYGPPASGKLTIAELLSQQTGIPIFHNHLPRDLVERIYNNDVAKHYELIRTIRLDVLDYCSRNETDLIFTYVYAGEKDNANVKRVIQTIENNKGEVKFVELTASRQDLIGRVDNESRKRFKKLTDPAILTDITEDMSIYSIPFVGSLKINTSLQDANESAKLISSKLDLV